MIVAIVPAAGLGSRMGRPKLTLPIRGIPLIVRVVSALREGGIDLVLVVTPPADSPGSRELGEEATRAGAAVLVTETRPADMRASVEHALAYIEKTLPDATRIVLTPADSPGITAELVALMLKSASEAPDSIVAPVVGGKRGHPIVIPWPVALQICELPSNVGVNALLKVHERAIRRVEVDDAGILDDLDTPEDYSRWNERLLSKKQDINVRDHLA